VRRRSPPLGSPLRGWTTESPKPSQVRPPQPRWATNERFAPRAIVRDLARVLPPADLLYDGTS